MKITDKFQLSLAENLFLAKKNIVETIHSLSRLENVQTTFAQTQTLIDGMSVSGVSTDDIQVILNLKNAWQFVLKSAAQGKKTFSAEYALHLACKINAFVAYNESLAWGELRTGRVGISGTQFEPVLPERETVKKQFTIINALPLSQTERILKTLYFMMRSQLFWDGNKRTAFIFANYHMICLGCGIIHIHERQLEDWNPLLRSFYESGDDAEIIQWTYQNCIHGIQYSNRGAEYE